MLDHDNHADRRQHSVNGSGREEIAQRPSPQRPKDDLKNTRDHTDRQHHPVGLSVGNRVRSPGIAKRRYRRHHHQDQTGGGTFDGQLGIAEERRHDRADDGG